MGEIITMRFRAGPMAIIGVNPHARGRQRRCDRPGGEVAAALLERLTQIHLFPEKRT